MKYPIVIKGKTIKQVTKLNLSGIGLKEIPENLFEYTNLTKLVLSNNRIQVIPNEILRLKKLKVLDLANNEIKILHSAVFKLPRLRTLNVYGNQIKKFPKQAMESSVQKLIVGKNPIEESEKKRLYGRFEVINAEMIKSLRLESGKKELEKKAKMIERKEDKTVEKKHSIFISYSHEDSDWLKKLTTHLKPLKAHYGVDEWDDRRLRTSDKWEEEISKAMNNATIAILLFSANFMASDFIINHELQPLLEYAELKGTKIIPVMVSPCGTFDESGLSRYQASNAPDKTLIEMNEGEVQRTFVKIVNDIKVLIS